MLRKILLGCFCLLLFIPLPGVTMKDMEEIENIMTPPALIHSPFGRLPPEKIIRIGKHLYQDDFRSFSFTCVSIRNILKAYKKFFMPETEEKIKEAIQKTSINRIPKLLSKWDRGGKKQTIPKLRLILTQFQKLDPSYEEINLGTKITFYRENLVNYIKIIYLLYGMGDLKAKETYETCYHTMQVALHEAIGDEENEEVEQPKHYIFYYENLAILNPTIRQDISKKYKEGVAPFKKNILKSQEYSEPLYSPFSANLSSLKSN